MTKAISPEKNVIFSLATRPFFKNPASTEGNSKKGRKPLRFLVHLGCDCVLNNLSLDYITGTELLNYIKACLLTYTVTVVAKGEESRTDNAPGRNSGFIIKFLNHQEFVKKASRLFTKSPWAKAA